MEGKRACTLERAKQTFQSTEEVTHVLRQEGVSQIRLVLAIDLSRANEWSGARSFHGALRFEQMFHGQLPHTVFFLSKKFAHGVLQSSAQHVWTACLHAVRFCTATRAA
jgi:hypothetical protein